MDISFSDEAITAIANAGFDPVYGARPLRREISNKLEDTISEKILDGTIKTEKKYILKLRCE